jgi:UPF0755 protein
MKGLKKVILVLLLLGAAVAAYFAYVLFAPALGQKSVELRLRKHWNIDTLVAEIASKTGMDQREKLSTWIPRLGYKFVKPCTIKIPAGCSIYQLVQILKQNRYQTVNVTILGGMDTEKLASTLASKLEIQADSVIAVLENTNGIYDTGFNDTTWPAFIMANTYNFAVATDLKTFVGRMKKEYDKFWTPNRVNTAAKYGLSPLQVMTLASIVSKESNKTDEYNNIAGVYINRLQKGMLLQADPTVVFARKETGRVLNIHLKIESPYNTYIHKGLPPGPLCIPNEAAVKAVLNYVPHNYLYFVANHTFDGYHHFSATLSEHNAWAALLHAAMNKRAALKRAQTH